MNGDEANCENCIFWKQARPSEGHCLRLAPSPAYEADRVAHWPTTHGKQSCGEFLDRGAAFVIVPCGECRYWRHPDGGLSPADKADKLSHWWAQAGLCIRHAPRPQSEPGPRAFWRASHVQDSCAESMPKPHMQTVGEA